MAIVAEIVGGPRDGELWPIVSEWTRVQFVIPRRLSATMADAAAPMSRQVVEMTPVATPQGWRLYWPKGAS